MGFGMNRMGLTLLVLPSQVGLDLISVVFWFDAVKLGCMTRTWTRGLKMDYRKHCEMEAEETRLRNTQTGASPLNVAGKVPVLVDRKCQHESVRLWVKRRR